MMGSHDEQEFCLKWNNHHNTLVSVLDSLLIRESLVDVVLAAEGKQIKVHRFVLFACSSYFQELLSQQLDKHAVVFMKDVRYADLKALVDFMYRGEVNISQYQLESFLQTAEALQIKGLTDKPNQRRFVSSLTLPSKSNERRQQQKASNSSQHDGESPPAVQPPKLVYRPAKASNKQKVTETVQQQEESNEVNDEEQLQESVQVESKVEVELEVEDDMETDQQMVDGLDQEPDQSDQESVRDEDEVWSAGNSQHSFDNNSASGHYPSADQGGGDMGNETWASENGAGTSENNYDLTMSDSSLGPDGGGDTSGLAIIEDENGGERPFYCPRCSRRYKRKNNAVAHLRYECGVVPSFPCPICSHMLSQRRYIQKHIRRKHPDYLQEYEEQKRSRPADDE